MSSRTIAAENGYSVEDIGHAWALLFVDNVNGRQVFLDGDGAADLRRDIGTRPLAALWNDFDHAAR